MSRVMLVKVDFKDKSDSMIKEFAKLLKEKSILRQSNHCDFVNGTAYIQLVIEPFDPYLSKLSISAISKKSNGQNITVKSIFGNTFKFKRID